MRRLFQRNPCLAFGLFIGLAVSEYGCEGNHNVAATDKTPADIATVNTVHLPAEQSSRIGLVVEPVTRNEFRASREFPASIQPNLRNMANITTLVRGRVMEVYADLGQKVEANTLLAILHSSDLGLAQSAYLKARAKLNVAAHAYTRAKYLLKEKVIGTAEAQRRHGELLSILADAHEARNRLRLLGVSEEELDRLDRSRDIRSHVPIVAPFAGRIIGRHLTRGEVVETTRTLFVIADLSDVWVMANIPEKDIHFIHSIQASGGIQAEVRVNAYPKEVFKSKITYVADVLDPTTRTMQLRLELLNPGGLLKPEMFASIRLFSELQPDQLAVPESALQREKDQTFVFVQRNENEYEVREVQVGESNGTLVTILDGLKEGDSVVTHGSFILKSELLKLA